METKLKSLNLQMEELKKIEDVKISSSQDSEVIPECKLYVLFTINEEEYYQKMLSEEDAFHKS